MVKANKVIRRAHQDQEWRVRSLVDNLDALIFVSASDEGSLVGMPRDGSQVGIAAMVAAESVSEDEGPVCVLEALSVAATSLAFDIMFCERMKKKFVMCVRRRHFASRKRRTAIDISALCESLNDGSGSLACGVTGPQQAADCLTKWLGNECAPCGADAVSMVTEGGPEVRSERERKRQARRVRRHGSVCSVSSRSLDS